MIITCDNEQTIGATVAALAWCDEVLVVDSGSSDRTVQICRSLGCRVLLRDFAGFGRQKHFAVLAATHDWVLVVDSDEVLTAELGEEIAQRLGRDCQHFSGFLIPISLTFMGRVLRFGGEFGKRHLRLFDRRAGNFDFAEVHESVSLTGRVGVLRHHVLHASYRDVAHYFEKFNLYTSAAAGEMQRGGVRTPKWLIPWWFPVSFFHLYFCKGLILDGYPGFVWALFSALYRTVKYVKLTELRACKVKGGP